MLSNQSRLLKEYKFLLLAWFPSQAQLYWAHKSPSSGLGEGELLCYMERLSPLSENKAPPVGLPTPLPHLGSSTSRVGAQGGQVALFGITDIALRCSGTLSK